MSSSIIVDVTITVATSSLAEFLKKLPLSYNGVIVEPECTLFEVAHRDNPETGETTVRLFEAWTCTKEWFVNVQLKKPYYEPYIEATKPMWTKDRVIEYYERNTEFSFVRPNHK
ncbi:hypothetical protein BDZ89DRAFT_1067863 [Hymenopellis radicata]|nr:hypothetical protein BDZ89DRAFT_1067863 [Hymenopellis radicata]